MVFENKKELKQCLQKDALANGKKTTRVSFFGDEIFKYIRALRHFEYYSTRKNRVIPYFYWKYRHHAMGIRYGFQVPVHVVGSGFSIAHIGTVLIANNASIGENFRIHDGCTIGSTNGEVTAATIGNNVFLGSGAKVIGNVTIADDVCIGANAVVVKDIKESGTTWGGVPAKKISEQNSHANLSKLLNL